MTAFYKLPPSLAVHHNENKLGQTPLTVRFISGAFEHCRYRVHSTNDLWPLIGAAYTLEPEFFVYLTREDLKVDDTAASFQICLYANETGFCIFQVAGNGCIEIFGEFSPKADMSTDFIYIPDFGWELAYFLPKQGFLKRFKDVIRILTPAFQNGDMPKGKLCFQGGDEILALYEKMKKERGWFADY